MSIKNNYQTEINFILYPEATFVYFNQKHDSTNTNIIPQHQLTLSLLIKYLKLFKIIWL